MGQIYRPRRNSARWPPGSNPRGLFAVLAARFALCELLCLSSFTGRRAAPFFLPYMTRTYRLLGLLATLALPLAACNSGTKAGDTNVELGSNKKLEANTTPANVGADSAAAGLARDTTRRPTGKQIYKSADRAIDRNHDGIAD